MFFISSASGYENGPGRQWVNVSNGIKDAEIEDVVVSNQDPDEVYVISDKAVYLSHNSGESWSERLSFRTTENSINAIALSGESDTVYVGTADGLFKGMDKGSTWERIFRGVGALENAVCAVAVAARKSEFIMIGTMSGIFLTEDGGRTWSKAKNIHGQSVVTSIAANASNQNIVYAASSKGAYKSIDRGASWNRIYELITPEEDYEYLFEDEEEDISHIKYIIKARDILVDPEDDKIIYLATSNGLFISPDEGGSWKRADSSGLLSRNIRSVIATGDHSLYAATDRGVFTHTDDSFRWHALSEGLSTTDIHSLDYSAPAGYDNMVLWSASGHGVFKTEKSVDGQLSGKNGMTVEQALSMFAHEPSLREIRQAAIEYAEVQPEKIKRWRKAASRKAWLPDLRLAYDDADDWQSSTYFYKNTYEEQYLTDDDITEGNDRGWSVSLTWELGDLIYNSAQTTIDVRSRLLVQLRDDILNEVTRLHFERRRMQIDMITAPAPDLDSRINNELRLQELTAGIDALTGSYLSKRLNR